MGIGGLLHRWGPGAGSGKGQRSLEGESISLSPRPEMGCRDGVQSWGEELTLRKCLDLILRPASSVEQICAKSIINLKAHTSKTSSESCNHQWYLGFTPQICGTSGSGILLWANCKSAFSFGSLGQSQRDLQALKDRMPW